MVPRISAMRACRSGGAKKAAACEPRRPEWGPQRAPGLRDESALREHDLDAAILRLAYAWRRRHAQVVHTATTDDHVAAGHAETLERGGHRVGTPLGQPLVVAGRTRGVGEAGNRELHAAPGFVVVGCERDDPL